MYLKDFLLHTKHTGSIAPSSSHLAKMYVTMADLDNKESVVELGPGNGCVSKLILTSMRTDATYFAIERNHSLVQRFKRNLPNAIIHEDSLVNLPLYLEKTGKDTCDCVISGIPWTNFTIDEQRECVNIIHSSIEEGGSFLTMVYLPSRYTKAGRAFKQLIAEMFKTVEVSSLVMRNLPPAYVYACTK